MSEQSVPRPTGQPAEPPAEPLSGSLGAADLHACLRVAEQWLALNREQINAINVYPVPDGDTGTNMLLTLRGALGDAEPGPGSPVGGYLEAVSRSALLSARGNSGVILSQMIRGLAEDLAGVETIDCAAWCSALAGASRVAYEAVGQPVEGTMLTVMREAAEAAHPAAATLADVLDAVQAEAHRSVERTPELLPALREAGVVDAGGLGVAVLLSGLRFGYLRQALPPPPSLPAGADAVVKLEGVEHSGHGYCTEFVISGERLDRGGVAAALEQASGESVLVVGDATALHVHVHLPDPGPALSIGVAAGALDAIKIDNMQAQHDRWAGAHAPSAAPSAASDAASPTLPPASAEGAASRVALVAVVQGDGLDAAFRELGATTVSGGATANPSAGELVTAADRSGGERVLLLPNHRNVILAAEQAAAAAPDRIEVIPTRSLAAGLAAAVAFQPDAEPEALIAAMRAAADATTCIEVTRAVRDATVDGVSVTVDDAIALVDGTLRARAGAGDGALEEALLAGLAAAIADRDAPSDAAPDAAGAAAADLVTLCLGDEATREAGARVAAIIEERHPQLTVELLEGGQPHYPYVAGVE